MQQPAGGMDQLVATQKHLEDLKNLKTATSSQLVFCPMCEKQINTTVETKLSMCQWGTCLAITCLSGQVYGLQCIPFCIPSFKDKLHKCG